ncbi:hypothetical protein J7T55_005738 [Diaporthe amygdali]|uniref:uncharacterized protein n=1 Tax=Phomopsis amygdali TaxID=1214568 RepID=UPI0022FEEE5D|nr:uncharacterized protein J7T55_005738 [Diaporthe amygdali]KAJ0124400.1 hypothetical protein J7T55_005738 [Diaporthe amygdali]
MTGTPQYVADSPLGGRRDLGDLVGSEAADTDDAGTEDYWPRLPISYGPPPTHLENAVKEVGYIMLLLTTFNVPDDGSGDISCISKLLLSLESRDDITKSVLEYTSFEPAFRRLANEKSFSENNAQKIASRAAALKQHWEKTRQDHPNCPQDIVYPPLLSGVPDKPENWKLELTDKAMEEAERYYHALKTQRQYAYRCFQTKPPMPMAWVPQGGDAWAKTARAKVESGDLFHSRLWSPVWMDFGLASIDVMFGMEAAGLTQDEMDEYHDASRTMSGMRTDFQGRVLRSEDILRA